MRIRISAILYSNAVVQYWRIELNDTTNAAGCVQAGMDQEIMFIYDPSDTMHALRRRFLSRMRYHRNAVIDIFANQTIVQGQFSRSGDTEKLTDTMSDTPNFTSQEFFKRKEELFAE